MTVNCDKCTHDNIIYPYFTEYDYIDESQMDDICITKSRAPVSDVAFYFAGVPIKTMPKQSAVRSSGSQQSVKSSWGLQDNRIPDIGIQQADKILLENLFGTAFAEQCRCYHKANHKQRSTSRIYNTLHEVNLCSPIENAVETRSNKLEETIYIPSNNNTVQSQIDSCSGGGYNSGANHSTLLKRDIDVTQKSLDRPYEKLDKQTMDPQLDPERITEYSEMGDISSQFYPLMAMLHSQNLKYINIISQRMFAMAMHQFDFMMKSNYTTPKYVSLWDEKEMANDQHHNHENPAKTAFGPPHLPEQGTPMPPMRKQDNADAVLVNGEMNHSLEPHDRSDDVITHSKEVHIPRQRCFLPDVDVNSDAICYLPSNMNPVDPGSSNYGANTGIDSFGLPLTTFEKEARLNPN